ncbi:sigma-70 family RNA polymerase sigma factor [Blastomonas sp.]|uniref:sigma-70 family RNA polymerase sigma factor n=1 Tax=Blastomonas sp. TaxID=1909299 RepID=UPI003593833D
MAVEPSPEQNSDASHSPLNDRDFKEQLAALIPHLRAYGRSLSGNRDVADDLVQDTMLKAWAARERFSAGTNMRAWTFIILRNSFLSQRRRSRFTSEWDDVVADRILSVPAGQGDQLHLADVQRALMQLPEAQREALILVGAGGFSYEEAADICAVALGTIKSRVARGRAALAALVDDAVYGDEQGVRLADPMGAIMADVDTLSGGLPGNRGNGT